MIPSDMSEWELGVHYTLSSHDFEVIKRRRCDHNRLGFAVQLCLFRYPGWSLSDMKHVPESVLRYIAKQIQVDPSAFLLYAEREQTKHEHMEQIRKVFGYSNFSLREYRKISQALFPYAMENENTLHLIRTAMDEMRKQKMILPAMTTIERLV